MEYRAAARQPPGQKAAVGLQLSAAALLPGVLVAAQHHGVPVLPQIEDAALRLHMLQQMLLQSQIFVGVGAGGPAQEDPPDHG